MSDRELGALTTLGFDELARASGGIGSIHVAIASRAFRASGPGALFAREIHDRTSRAVYAGLGAGTRVVGMVVGAAVGLRAAHRRAAGQPDPPQLSTTRGGAALVAAIAGLRGDALEEERSALAQPMAVRVDGAPVALEPDALSAAFANASPCLVVFLHGLMQTEFSWGAHETYGARLERELGCTPVYVRYNSGLHISENGRCLSELMEELVAAWPIEVERVALVGHSMGGLVGRSACYRGVEDGADWVGRVRHSV